MGEAAVACSATTWVRLLSLAQPPRLCRRAGVCSYCDGGDRILTVSKDSTARIFFWRSDGGAKRSIVLDSTMGEQQEQPPASQASTAPRSRQRRPSRRKKSRKPQVHNAVWDAADRYVVTSQSMTRIGEEEHDSSVRLKVWDSRNGKLVHILTHHRRQVHVLRRHPMDCRIVLAADYAGAIVLWDIENGSSCGWTPCRSQAAGSNVVGVT